MTFRKTAVLLSGTFFFLGLPPGPVFGQSESTSQTSKAAPATRDRKEQKTNERKLVKELDTPYRARLV